MPRFTKTQQQERTFQAFEEKIDKLKGDLAPYADCVRLDTLDEVKVHFIKRTSDFFREDRKLNIGVIGQVKAGKSSFLNTLLFDGHKVLPSAATPKTATLTKIEYGEQNRLCVEYYTPEEWAVLEHNASVDSMESEFVVAREIMSMVAANGIVPAQYTQKGGEEFHFQSANQLMEQLNDYVGENGKYTPLVKNVTIQMDRPELRDISVVDTPGLNDAIASRTDRTRQFVELCDVVFFLSRASQFMDNNDMKLLASQLPQRGVKELVMICSRFDDGLADIILDAESIEEAIRELERDLTKRAVSVVNGVTQNPELHAILEPCKKPIAGEDGVAAYGVLMYVNMIFLAAFIGYSVGTSPVIGYHYGANNQTELKSLLKKSGSIICAFAICMFVFAEVLANPLAGIFVGYDETLMDMTINAFRIFSFSFLCAGFSIFGSAFFTALNNGLISALISFLRTLVFQVIAVLVLPIFFGLNGIWFSIVTAEIISVIVTFAFIFGKRKKYGYM